MAHIDNIVEIIELAKRRNGWRFDAELDRALGHKGSGVAQWRSGASLPKEEHVPALAELAGLPELETLFLVRKWHAAKKKNNRLVELYEKAIKVASAAAIVWALAVFTPSNAHAGTYGAQSPSASETIYIMRFYGMLRSGFVFCICSVLRQSEG